MSRFIHLCTHSSYSIRDGLASPHALIKKVKELGYPAVALTDEANMFAVLKFFHSAWEEGIKPILGMDLSLIDEKSSPHRISLLVKDATGYQNLMQLSTYAQTPHTHNGQRGCVPRDFFVEHSRGLLVLSGAADGDIGKALLKGDSAAAEESLKWWLDLCGDNYYLELHRLGLPQEERLISETLLLAKTHKCPPLATNDVRFLIPDDFEVHRLRVCIHHNEVMGRERRSPLYQKTQYLRPPAEMEKLFADIPAALENTALAVQRCNFSFKEQSNLPVYPYKGKETAASLLRKNAYAGMAEVVGTDWIKKRGGEYQKRLHTELEIIAAMGFGDYFLIVSDFVRWAKDQDIAVGPGRGSGAGSLVAYATSITGLDPLVHNLFFERFLNPGRAAMPDFDIDICMERRDEVIHYIRATYGEKHAVQIISFGTMGARGVIRDVTRALGKPFGLGDKIARLIPETIHIKLSTALVAQPALKEIIDEDEEAHTVYDYATALEGVVRHTGSHAAGLVITPRPVAHHCPLYADDQNLVTQFDKDDLEIVGLVKFDVLGLRTLTVIDESLRLIKKYEEKDVNMDDLPLDDGKTLQLVRSAQTYGIFQLESRGMRDVAKRMEPQSFEDIIALIALFRPGPMELIDKFIENKKRIEKEKAITYPHPSLEDVLRPTYGIAVYQEQIMQMAQILAGFSLAQADVLRHAMGKKKMAIMQEQQQAFIQGAVRQGYQREKAEELFTTVEKFAGYGFNRSHSVGYALLAYRTAYLKVHHPRAFLAATMSSEILNHKKIARLIEEAQSLKIKIMPPDINESPAAFDLTEDGKSISYGLAYIKGIGRKAAKHIVAERQQGSYRGFFDFCRRADGKILTRPLLESLIRAGAFLRLETNQALLMESIERGAQHNKNSALAADMGLSDMFAGALKKEIFMDAPSPWHASRALKEEKTALGFALRGDAFKIYKEELRGYIQTSLNDIYKGDGRTAHRRNRYGSKSMSTLCGRIAHRRNIARAGKKDIITFSLQDDTGDITVRLEPQVYEKKERLIVDDNILIAKGYIDAYKNVIYLQGAEIYGMEYLRSMHCKGLLLETNVEKISRKKLAHLKESILPYTQQQGLPLYLQIRTDRVNYRVRFLKKSMITPSNECMDVLREIFPESAVLLL